MKESIVPHRYHPNDVVVEAIFVRKKMRISAIVFFVNVVLAICFYYLEWFSSALGIIFSIVGFGSLLSIVLFRLFEEPIKIELKYPKFLLSNSHIIH